MWYVIVHDDKTRIQWRLAVAEKLILGKDNLIRAALIRMGTYRTTHPIEVSSVTQAKPRINLLII